MTDTLGWRRTIAILTTSMNSVVQPELEAMRPPGVTNHIYRMRLPDMAIRPAAGEAGGFAEIVHHVGAGLDDAVREAMTCRPDQLLPAVSIESVWGGGIAAGQRIAERVSAIAGAEMPLTQAGAALQAALGAFGVRRVGLLTPYSADAEAEAAGFLREIGMEVTRIANLHAGRPSEIAALPAATIRAAVQSLAQPDVDVIVQFGGNLPMAAIAAEAERALARPVIATNTACYWHALRSGGIMDRATGQGRLLEEF